MVLKRYAIGYDSSTGEIGDDGYGSKQRLFQKYKRLVFLLFGNNIRAKQQTPAISCPLIRDGFLPNLSITTIERSIPGITNEPVT